MQRFLQVRERNGKLHHSEEKFVVQTDGCEIANLKGESTKPLMMEQREAGRE